MIASIDVPKSKRKAWIFSTMSDSGKEDSLTKLNTALNRSMVLMERTTETSEPVKRSKSIKINTSVEPLGTTPVKPVKSRKSILKRTEPCNGVNGIEQMDADVQQSQSTAEKLPSATEDEGTRPQTLQELVETQKLAIASTDPSISFDDISDSEDVWIVDIPITVNPQLLRGHMLQLGERSKLKIGDDSYYAIQRGIKENITCVFNAGKQKKQYRTVNVKPAGALTVRRKLSGNAKIKYPSVETTSVPFPKNLKTRHPLFGAMYEDKLKKLT
ncbi:uncharacterized protein LOC105701877 [Orussus abietinus]|uniref:uncharacterized protein LOC105701877 n=1 Tax=Orussus abietinus TaxID=222816 RepID=UPI0006261109|nr:uncharacterized protein LOC105701877 [Orussus abietinus]